MGIPITFNLKDITMSLLYEMNWSFLALIAQLILSIQCRLSLAGSKQIEFERKTMISYTPRRGVGGLGLGKDYTFDAERITNVFFLRTLNMRLSYLSYEICFELKQKKNISKRLCFCFCFFFTYPKPLNFGSGPLWWYSNLAHPPYFSNQSQWAIGTC